MGSRSLRLYECHVGMSGEQPRVASYSEFADQVLPRVKVSYCHRSCSAGMWYCDVALGCAAAVALSLCYCSALPAPLAGSAPWYHGSSLCALHVMPGHSLLFCLLLPNPLPVRHVVTTRCRLWQSWNTCTTQASGERRQLVCSSVVLHVCACVWLCVGMCVLVRACV